MKLVAAILLCACLVAPVQSQGPIGTGTRPLSPSAAGTLVTRNGMLELVILWRGAPGWHLAAERQSGGGSGDSIGGVVEYGTVRLEYSYAAASHLAHIQDTPVPLAEGRNVVMVDNVDSPGGPVVAGTARLDGRYDSPQTALAPIIGGSPEVAQFLRCEIPLPAARLGLPADAPDDVRDRMLNLINRVFVCADLKR